MFAVQPALSCSLISVICSDILSFYKEELVGEQANFVHERARVTGKSIQQALRDTLDEVVDAVIRAREVLHGEQERGAWESFLEGYVVFHFYCPRYKLMQLFRNTD